MNERREPTIAPLNIDEGQAGKPQTGREQIGQARAQPSVQVRPARSTPPPVSSRTEQTQSSVLPAFVFALLSCVGVGFVFYQLLQTQKLLEGTSTLLMQSETRIVELEKKLELTGDESVQSMAVLQSNIKTNASEIKKLWGVAYDRNKKAIEDNKASIDALAKTYQSTDSKLNKALADLKADVSVLNELMNAQQGVLTKVDKVSLEQKNTLTVLSEKLQSLDSKLTKKVLSNEEAINSMDEFRLQVNRELIQLKGG